jgi:CheR methyltransferase, SAM binding domain
MVLVMTAVLAAPGPLQTMAGIRQIQYADLPSDIQKRFAADGIPARDFPGYLRSVETDTERRVSEGEREHLIFYALQSQGFTRRPPIEPAVSARRFVESLTPADRILFLEDPTYQPPAGWPSDERARVAEALSALGRKTSNARLAFFKRLLPETSGALSPDALYPDYVRVVRFLYQKEFASSGVAADIAQLYQTRPHSSDTQIEAGFGVYLGLGTLHALEPDRRINRVLVVGPGLDLAPRTDLVDVVAPQTYQPFAVADAILTLSAGSETDLHIHSVDVNPQVVRVAQLAAREPVTLHLFTGIAETGEQPFSADYRSYVERLGRAIGRATPPPAAIASDRRYRHSIAVRDTVRRALSAERLNIVTERLVDRPGFDLVVITNVLPYFDDRQLALAFSNIAAMLRPSGYLLHNESRAGLAETASSMQIPVLQMRTATIGGSRDRPLYDTVWLHRKSRF